MHFRERVKEWESGVHVLHANLNVIINMTLSILLDILQCNYGSFKRKSSRAEL